MSTKRIISYAFAFVVAVGLIFMIDPLLASYKENKKYDFTLNTSEGEINKKDFEGKVLAVFFGYTYCPDVCPTSLSSLAADVKSFPDEKSKNFAGLFISVDPKRDKLQHLKEYSEYFHPSFVGATSNKENIDDIVKRYRAYYQFVELENSAMKYSVSHTAYIYFFDKNGKFAAKVDHVLNPNAIKEVLEKLL